MSKHFHYTRGIGHLLQQKRGRSESISAEENPSYDHCQEGDRPSAYLQRKSHGEVQTGAPPGSSAPKMIDHEIDPVQSTPCDECPCSSMPKTTDQHHQHQV